MDRLFADLLHPIKLKDITERIKEYANKMAIDIYMLSYPKSDLPEMEDTLNFILMSPGHFIVVVNNNDKDEVYNNYVSDVKDTILYLYQKYGYRSELGRYQQWSKGLIVEKQIEELDDLSLFFDEIKVSNPNELRNSQLLLSLCTGSINDIKRIKSYVPQSLLDKVKQRIQVFDADQTRFIYQDLSQKVIKIQGLSGTGKTELLLHKLKGLYLANDTNRIFFTCHNRILADSLKNRIPRFFDFMKVTQQIEWNKRLWCSNAWGSSSFVHSGLYRYICFYYQIPFHSYSRFNTFDTVCREAIEYIKEKRKSSDFNYALDYVLIDECQDFKPSFIDLCKLITKSKVFLAGDIFQSIFSDFDQNEYKADYYLSKCYRTDPKTLMISQALGLGLLEEYRFRWLSEDNWKACGYSYCDSGDSIVLSREPIHRFSEDEQDINSFFIKKYNSESPIEQIIGIIKSIRQEYTNVLPGDISVILLDNSNDIYEWSNNLERRLSSTFGWMANKAYETKTVEEDKVLISNRNNVKGLEYPFVICVTSRIGTSYDYRNALYTMLSRSFLVTYLLISGAKDNGLVPGIIEGINEIQKDHRMTIRKPSTEEANAIKIRFTQAQNEILKPFDEKVMDIIISLGIPAEKRGPLHKMIMSTSRHWEDLSIEELSNKIGVLSSAL